MIDRRTEDYFDHVFESKTIFGEKMVIYSVYLFQTTNKLEKKRNRRRGKWKEFWKAVRLRMSRDIPGKGIICPYSIFDYIGFDDMTCKPPMRLPPAGKWRARGYTTWAGAK